MSYKKRGFTSFLGKAVLGAAIFYIGHFSGSSEMRQFKNDIQQDVSAVSRYMPPAQQRNYVDDYVSGLTPNERVKTISGYIQEMPDREQEMLAFRMYNSLSDPAKSQLNHIIEGANPPDRYDKAAGFIRELVGQF
ncbi:hypothetical protein JW968_02680 [Candidatus Woesearchaeota archaeon]|nr:hypothetical protein [Candidatus Woesearchaeota archaeon]